MDASTGRGQFPRPDPLPALPMAADERWLAARD